MVKKLTFSLIVVILIMQFTGVLSALADENITNKGDISSVPEANISVKVLHYYGDDRIYEGREFEITLSVKNDSALDIEEVYVTVNSSSSFYIPKDRDQSYLLNTIPANGYGKIEKIPLKYKGSGNELILNIKYKIGNNTGTTTATLYIDNVVEKKMKQILRTL